MQLRLETGDLLVSEGGDVGRSCLWADELDDCYFQNSVNRVRARDGNSNRYLYYWMTAIKYKGYIDVLCNKSTIAHFTAEKVAAVPVPLPPHAEQFSIATFLDRETAKIDELIAEQQRFVELLKEKRQAVISHAVTKGLNPDAPMKDSGIEWLGEVPEHWAVCKISYRYEILLGKMLDEKKISGMHLGRYLRNTDVQWDQINNEELPQMDFHPEEIDRYQVNKGDLLVCEGGEIGRCAIWGFDEPCFYQKALHRVRPYSYKKDYPRFLFYVISDAVNQERFVSRANKATIAHLPAEVFRQYRFAFPDYEAQVEIAKYLDREKMKFDKLLEEVEESIRLLVERRTALISAAVTGKIKVTGIAE